MQKKDSIRFKLTIAYEGSGYAGWQVQKKDVGVQQRVEEALRELFPSVRRIHSSSRTDTGVHALGMVAHVDVPKTEFKMELRKLALALNSFLPADIRIVRAVRAKAGFHAQYDAKGKQYRYVVWNDVAMNPLLINRAWHVAKILDLAAMKRAARLFVGKRNYRSFASNRNYEMETYVRRLTRCEVRRSGKQLTFVIEGDGFLYKMCRGIVGTLVQVGEGRLNAAAIRRILKAQDRRVAGMNAPACGLVLWKVLY
ncbi:MAG: tRNA pseudouridine(38-40) synthase TruA [Verrucomicrobiota bacterium]|jgi:tRNA pseudouridine38-40 synthase|nr:tRNA pseudouridine(38-40) synthase TruA [Verrucomicrobiota bacterium]